MFHIEFGNKQVKYWRMSLSIGSVSGVGNRISDFESKIAWLLEIPSFWNFGGGERQKHCYAGYIRFLEILDYSGDTFTCMRRLQQTPLCVAEIMTCSRTFSVLFCYETEGFVFSLFPSPGFDPLLWASCSKTDMTWHRARGQNQGWEARAPNLLGTEPFCVSLFRMESWCYSLVSMTIIALSSPPGKPGVTSPDWVRMAPQVVKVGANCKFHSVMSGQQPVRHRWMAKISSSFLHFKQKQIPSPLH